MADRILGIPKEIAPGIVLALAAIAGLLAENIQAFVPFYDALLGTKATVAIGTVTISKPLLLWINDGLMAIFFMVVALEIKREVREGALSKWSEASLPVYGAIGGIVVPALVFLAVVGLDSPAAQGWAIPAATDIAFALGVLSLFGNRVPAILKTFLLTLAVVDDLAAIGIIAVFYTASLSFFALSIAGAALAALIVMNLMNVRSGIAYFLIGAILWAAVLKSGVHATLAGVALGFTIPLVPGPNGRSLAKSIEHALHPWVGFLVLPVFAFANAGVPLAGLSLDALLAPLALAIALGLFFGKQIGVFGMVWLAHQLKLSHKPDNITWAHLYAVSCLAGIGFTMSLFIGGLAFESVAVQNTVRLGVISGSLLSGIFGAVVLWMVAKAPKNQSA